MPRAQVKVVVMTTQAFWDKLQVKAQAEKVGINVTPRVERDSAEYDLLVKRKLVPGTRVYEEFHKLLKAKQLQIDTSTLADLHQVSAKLGACDITRERNDAELAESAAYWAGVMSDNDAELSHLG